MSSDNQYTALGPAAVGFQTDGANIDHGAEISGKSVGVHASCDGGDGVAGQSGSSKNSGVWGNNSGGGYGVSGSSPAGVGVWGSSLQQGANLVDSGEGVRGDGKIGVHGVSRDSDFGGVWGENSGSGYGVKGYSIAGNGVYGQSGSLTNSGVWGENTGGGFGVAGSSAGGEGVLGDGKNGVHGRSSSATDSGVWGENTGGGFGVAGSSVSGEGVLGDGKNGVHGRSRSQNDSGVWGENTGAPGLGGYGVSGSTNSQPPQAGVWGHNYGSGYGVRGDSSAGEGVFGQGKNGVHGQSGSPTDSGMWGENTGTGVGVAGSSVSGYGGDFTGGRAPLRLRPSGGSGHPTSGQHSIGELYVDVSGQLYFCIANGTPGNWKMVQLV